MSTWIALTVTPKSNYSNMKVIDQSETKVWNFRWDTSIEVYDWGMLLYKTVPADKIDADNHYIIRERKEWVVLNSFSGSYEIAGPDNPMKNSYRKGISKHARERC